MLNKLSFRNARRSAKDYSIYILTMTLISMLMFAFNGMLFSQAIQDLLADATSLIVIFGMASFFILIIVVWMTKYIINFMLERRSKEFGNYLLIGMTKKQITKMFRREHIILGGVTFLLGIIPGYLVQVAFVNIFYSIFGVTYSYQIEFSLYTYLLALLYYVIAYGISLFRLGNKFKKMEIVDLLSLENQNEKKIKAKVSEKVVFFASLSYIVLFHIFVYTGLASNSFVVVLIIGLALAIYGVFIGLSAYLTAYIEKGKGRVNRRENIFIFRQLSAKIRTMRFTMGTLTVLFTVTILSFMCVLMFDGYRKEAFDMYLMPIDVLYVSEEENEDFAKPLATIEEFGEVTAQYTYVIYQNGNTQLNDYLKPKTKGEYFGYDTFMALSDYNYLRELTGYEAVDLAEDSYLLQVTARLEKTFVDYGEHNQVNVAKQALKYQDTETIPFTQAGTNGADYLIVVADSLIETMTPYYEVLAANVSVEDTYGLARQLEQDYLYVDEDGEPDGVAMTLEYGNGSEDIITLGSPLIVREDLVHDYTNSAATMSFALGYIGAVFLIVAMSILAIQQLSDTTKYKYCYQILGNLGVNQREKNKIVLKQLALYYLFPVAITIFLGLFLGIFLSSAFVANTGLINVFGPQYYLSAVGVFLVLFLLYFVITYVSFLRMIEK
ncbi:putative ABC transport system permease protein [Enterococcus sp. PF1-24]|uniref:ABC transporter permease n=1 Tax=unclassified Enterococcus TaxID=2608891 RepID=UPI002474045A|nr:MULTISPECIES: ABC transporter permease [unclassified Enterococcus]MDH6364176.1 putative ABC transport system permease protein [Enterococcus sp. PFB1-1]MDH6401277.1 putative ABC transport system permease protein [Enterococcus sp. PF1-24]